MSRSPRQPSRSGRRHAWARAVVASIGAAFLFASGAGALPPPTRRPDDQIILLEVRLDRAVLTDVLATYRTRDDLLLPLGELCGLLQIAVSVDPATGRAVGFVENEADGFELDMEADGVEVAGRSWDLSPDGVERHEGDIFVSTALLARWLPLDFRIDFQAATLTVLPRRLLPLQRRWARESRLVGGRGDSSEDGLGRVPNPHRLLDGFALDQSLQLLSTPAVDPDRITQVRQSMFLAMDLLYMESNLYLSGTVDRPAEDSRFSLSRHDPGAGLLGPIGARHIGLFEIYQPAIDLVTVATSGPGVLVSNYPLSRPTQFDRHTFRGDLRAGWEVELYRNDALIGYQPASAGGEFEFADVPLLFGVNAFRLVFHGPQGQRQEESRVFNIGESLTPPGRIHYRMAWSDPRSLDPRTTAEVDIGLTGHLSGSLRLAEVKRGAGFDRFALAGSRIFWGRLFAGLDGAANDDGGSMAQGTLSARLGPGGLLVRHADLHDFQSEFFAGGVAGLRSRSTLRAEAALSLVAGIRLVLSADARRDRFGAGRNLDQVEQRLAASWRGYAASNQIRWSRDIAPDTPGLETADGIFLASRQWLHTGLRVEVNYNINPSARVRDFSLTAERRFGGLALIAGLRRGLDAEHWRQSLSVGRGDGPVAFSLGTTHSSREGVGGSINLNLGLSRDPRSGQLHARGRSMASSGLMSARVFLDRNANGVAEPGDVPLSGVGILVNGGGQPVLSGADGLAFITDLPPHEEAQVGVASSTLENPQWVAGAPVVKLVPRPGQVARVDFPVFLAGEVTGTLYRLLNGRKCEVSGFEMGLVDAKTGEVVKRGRTAYDGFYCLPELTPGRYLLTPIAAQCARLGCRVPPARVVEIKADGTILDGLDFTLEPATLPIAAR